MIFLPFAVASIRNISLTGDQVNYINVGLILISCVVAFVIPFELFLFSYAVLGPLHYLTEIGWLHKKSYFTKGRYDFLFLSLICGLVFYLTFLRPAKTPSQGATLFLYGLFAALVFGLVKDRLYRIVLLLLGMVALAFAKTGEMYIIWAGIFLPTIIHVFLFTWAFMLFGVLKAPSFSGYLSVAVLVAVALSFFIIPAQALQYKVSEAVASMYEPFAPVNTSMIYAFGSTSAVQNIRDTIYGSNTGFVVMRFIAFAYTYHYLNWFSKTSVIKWHKVPRRTLLVTLALWIFSVGLYFYNFSVGIKALALLSYLHVFLEFPLNVISFQGIYKSLIQIRK